jgi:hypothetical protein
MGTVLMWGSVAWAGPELVVLRGRVALAGRVCRRLPAGVQLVPFGPEQASHHQFVRMIDQVKRSSSGAELSGLTTFQCRVLRL